ncbi:hypothetical protein GCM10010172_29260 [Paractinoplanes ferrugineus]|uniref:Uncharacterized protein n=1 Tax=Paractinoplanes ferrugineus TaxID=113564 RepID=A0A919MBA1_9ACTN|nr:hypothetical protein [Actinoplanes ferrugineus]GIE08164.1 hypothetical protein Afe05nite_00040 [Actinoplanes ferrugineus]
MKLWNLRLIASLGQDSQLWSTLSFTSPAYGHTVQEIFTLACTTEAMIDRTLIKILIKDDLAKAELVADKLLGPLRPVSEVGG